MPPLRRTVDPLDADPSRGCRSKGVVTMVLNDFVPTYRKTSIWRADRLRLRVVPALLPDSLALSKRLLAVPTGPETRSSDAAFSHGVHRKTVGSRVDRDAPEGNLLRRSAEPGSLNMFSERVCSYFVRAVPNTRLNGASPALAAERRPKGVSSVSPLRLAGAFIKWRGLSGTGGLPGLGIQGLKPAQGLSCALLRNRGAIAARSEE